MSESPDPPVSIPTFPSTAQSYLNYISQVETARDAKAFQGKVRLEGLGVFDMDSTPDMITSSNRKWYYVGTYDGVGYYNEVKTIRELQ